MAKLSAGGVYRLANQAFKDDNQLATFNLLYEINNGELHLVNPVDLLTDDMQLLGVIGHVLLLSDHAIINIRGHDGQAEVLLNRMKDLIIGLPDETDEERDVLPEVTLDFPTTLAAVAAWMTPEGTIKFALYNHPQVPTHRANLLLKKLLTELEVEEKTHGKSDGNVGAN